MLKRLEHVPQEERLRELELFSLEKTQRDLIKLYKLSAVCCKRDRTRLFSVEPSSATKDNRDKLKHRRFLLYIKKKGFFYC